MRLVDCSGWSKDKQPLSSFRGGKFKRRHPDEGDASRQAITSGENNMFQDTEIGAMTAGGAPFGYPPHSKYEKLISLAKEVPPATTVVVHPCDETSLRGPCEAAELGIIMPILVGPVAKITAVAKQHGIDISRYEVVDAPHSETAAAKGVELIREGKGELLMKGSLHTDELMREVTSATTGLRTARRISHVFIMDVPTHAETLFLTDAAINIFPDLEAKRDIVQNAIDLFTQIGLGTPRVAHPLGGRDGHTENSVHDRRGGALQDGRPRPDHGRHSRWAARVRQRHQSTGRGDQGHQVGGGRARANPGRARSRGGQHARQESHFPVKC